MTADPPDSDLPEGREHDSQGIDCIGAELERVIGPKRQNDPPVKFQWLLPVTSSDQLLELLRGAPSGIGVSGLATYLRDRLGTLSGLARIDDVE